MVMEKWDLLRFWVAEMGYGNAHPSGQEEWRNFFYGVDIERKCEESLEEMQDEWNSAVVIQKTPKRVHW